MTVELAKIGLTLVRVWSMTSEAAIGKQGADISLEIDRVLRSLGAGEFRCSDDLTDFEWAGVGRQKLNCLALWRVQ